MKKLILTGIVCIAFLNISNGQTEGSTSTSNSDASFGIKGGVNFTNLYTEDVDDNNVLTSFNVGLFVNLPVTSGISIQPELNFSRKGAELTYNNAFLTGTSRFKLNYIEAPLLLKLNVTENFNIHFGPYVAYLIDAQATNETSNGTFNFEDNIDNDDLNKFDYGLSGGIGFDFQPVSIGVRYNYGLQTVGKEQTINGNNYTFPDSKNSALSIYAAFKF